MGKDNVTAAATSEYQRIRPTIGLFIETIAGRGNWYQAAVWEGVVAAAKARDFNLICLAGGTLDCSPSNEFELQRNVLYELMTPSGVDGLIISGSLGSYTTAEKFADFCRHYQAKLPVVTIAAACLGIPSVLVGNQAGEREIVQHLIEKHGYRRIAFIRGPENNPEAEERYQGYCEALTASALAIDADLVVPGDFFSPSGEAAIERLLAQRKSGVEAIVAANDSMAMGALKALQTRGIRVPQDIALVGFDDTKEGRATMALTTVHQPVQEQARQAVELLLALLAGQPVSERVVLPTTLKIRQSCGCPNLTVSRAAASATLKPTGMSPLALDSDRIVAELANTTAGSASDLANDQLARLVAAFVSELTLESSGRFLITLDECLNQTPLVDSEVTKWQETISALRQSLLPYLRGDQRREQAEDLWQQARAMIGDNAYRAQRLRRLQAELQAETLHEINQALVTTSDESEVMAVLVESLPRLKIPSCYVSLYENPVVPTERSRRLLAYPENDGGLAPTQQNFPTRQLVPKKGLPRAQSYNLVFEPMYVRENQLGIAVFEVGPLDGTIYETLRGQLSSALWSARLVQFLRSLSEASAEILSLKAPEDILQDVTHRVCKAVGAKRADIVLVDSSWRPRRLVPDGNHVNPFSTAGLANTTGFITDVLRRNEPILIENLLAQASSATKPMTDAGLRAAACFPLRLRDRPIGVMWVWYEKPHAFPLAEVDALRLYVNQAALAYDHARQMKELEHLRQAAEKLASVAEVQEVLKQIVQSARQVLQASSTVIWSYDADRKVFLPAELVANGVNPKTLDRFREDDPRPGGTGTLVIEKGYLAVNNVESEEHNYLNTPARGLRREIGVKSFQGIALQVDGQPLGVLYANYEHTYGFDEEDKAILEAFAYHAALALKKARLLQQVRRSHDTAQVLARVSVVEDLQHMLQAVAEGTRDAVGCEVVTVFVFNPTANKLKHPPTMAGVRYPDRASLLQEVARDSIVYKMLARETPCIVEMTGKDPLFRDLRFVKDEGIESCVAFPLQAADTRVGVMFVNYRSRHRFTSDELADIKLFAQQAAAAIRNAQLLEAATRSTAYLTALYEASKVIASTLALGEILDRIAEQAWQFTGRHGKQARFSYIALVEQNKLNVRTVYPPNYSDNLRAQLIDIDLNQYPIGITGQAVKTGISQLVGNVTRSRDYVAGYELTRSELAVPIKFAETVIGVINVEHTDQDAFDIEDQIELEALARLATIAIHNARLFEEAQHQALQLTTASKVARDATAILEVDQLLDQTVKLISDRFGFYHAGIFLLDENREFAVLKAASSQGGQRMLHEQHRLKVGKVGIVGLVASTGTPRVAHDVAEDAVFFDNHWLPDTRSEMALPLIVRGQVVGVLDVQSSTMGAFSDSDVATIQIFAGQMANAFENARLYQVEQRRVRELSALNRVSQSIRSLTSISEVYQQVNESIAILVGAKMCAILLYDLDEQALISQLPMYGVPDEIGLRYRIPLVAAGIVDEIWQAQDYLILNSVRQSPLLAMLNLTELAEEAGLEDTVLVKLTVGNRRIGLIQASNKVDGKPFDEDEARLLFILAGQAAAIIENARLYQELDVTKGRVGAMTAVAWMGLVVSAWRHAIGNNIAVVDDLVRLIRTDIANKVSLPQIIERLNDITEVVDEIKKIPMPPLSAEEGVESVAVNQLIAERMGQLQLRKGEYARTEFISALNASDMVTIRVSREWLKRVLDTLVDNAVNAMSDGPTRKLRISTRLASTNLEVAISDTGSGMPSDVKAVLFKKPINKPKGAKGAGLGLFLAQAVLQTYGGQIELGSTGMEGTTMIMRLPIET